MKGFKQFGVLIAAFGFAMTGVAFGPAAAQTVDYGGSNGRVHYDHHRDRGDHHHRHRRHHAGKRDHHDRDRNDHRRRANTVIPRGNAEVPGSSGGAYVGNVSEYRDPGNGSYIYIERDGAAFREGSSRSVPSARIVRPGDGSAACSNEAGVCVIRPGG